VPALAQTCLAAAGRAKLAPGSSPLPLRGRAGVLLVMGLVAGCGEDQDPRGKRSAGTPARTAAVRVASDADRTLEFPSCDGAFVPERRILRAGWRQRSTRVGPLTILETQRLAKRAPPGRRAWKVRTLIPPVRAITVEIDAGA
jgi:hypothetical protein